MMEVFITLAGVWVLLQWHEKSQRRFLVRRKLHALIHPLNHYLILLDHELQSADHPPDSLPTQAVLDHVTEMRSLLIRPDSHDLSYWKEPNWVKPINSVLVRLEENLELALQQGWEERSDLIRSDVKNLLADLQSHKELRSFVEKKVGLIEP